MSLKAMNSFIIVEEISETKSSTGMIMGNPSSDIIKGVVSVTSVDTVSVGDTVYFHKMASASMPDGKLSVKTENIVAVEIKE